MGSSFYGAEINIGNFETQFLKGSFRLENLEVTDKKNPSLNLIQVKSLRGDLLLDALLRFKFVIKEASVEKVEFYKKRKKPGKIFPPSSSKANPLLLEFQDTAVEKLKKEEKGNLLGDVAASLGGMSYKDQVQEFKNSLESGAHLKNLEMELKRTKEEWKEQTKILLNKKEWESWLKKHESKWKSSSKNFKKPKDLFLFFQEIKDLLKELKEKKKLIQSLKKAFSSDQLKWKKSFQDLEEKIKKDKQALKKRFLLPSLDAKEVLEEVFTEMLHKKLSFAFQYIEALRSFVPKKSTSSPSSKEEWKKQIREKRSKRTQGKIHSFPLLNSYPFFWLQKAHLSSEFSLSHSDKTSQKERGKREENSKQKKTFSETKSPERASRFQGELFHLSSHPFLLEFPMRLRLEGDFPEWETHGVLFEFLVDHRERKSLETLKFKVKSYPLPSLLFSKHKNLLWESRDSRGSLEFTLSLKDDMFEGHIKQKVFQTKHYVQSKSQVLERLLKDILLDFEEFQIEAFFHGPYGEREKWKSKISSDFGSSFSRRLKIGIKKEIKKV